MKTFERVSGLVIAKENEDEAEQRRFGYLEVRDENQRQEVEQVLLNLWDAMGFSNNPILSHNDFDRREAQRALYRYIGEQFLAEDCPEKEILC